MTKKKKEFIVVDGHRVYFCEYPRCRKTAVTQLEVKKGVFLRRCADHPIQMTDTLMSPAPFHAEAIQNPNLATKKSFWKRIAGWFWQ